MPRALAGLSIIAILSGAASGQTPPLQPSSSTLPSFDIADIHPSVRTTALPMFMTGGILRGGRYELRRATMVDLIRTAWGVDTDAVFGGPSWLETDRFDLVALAPAATPPETVRLMLQALLIDRFKLELHKDTKPLPAWVLTTGKGKPKIKESDGSGDKRCQPQRPAPEPGSVPKIILTCRNIAMEGFATSLHTFNGGYMDRPVINSTGLPGAWDFEIKYTPRQLLPRAGAGGVNLFDAVDKQLGLRLEMQKVSSPVLVVDKVNETPTPNAANIAQALPPRPAAEFEVAVIKPSMPDTKQIFQIHPGGSVDWRAVTLKALIAMAWSIDSGTKDLIGDEPKWLAATRYDIQAKASTSTFAPGGAATNDFDDFQQMLRALLVDRFKLATHYEDRPVTALNLVAVGPKLKRADPASRTSWRERPGPDGKDPRNNNPALSRLVTFQNTTMAQFADLLQTIASGYIHSPVLDATGLDGAWDFTLSFSAINLFPAGPTRPADFTSPLAASDPNGAIDIFDALSRQPGLKLEEVKRPAKVLVIDHVEKKPTPN